MARKGKKKAGKALAVRGNTALSQADMEDWERALALHAEEDAERLGSGEGGSLSIRNSRFKYMGEDLGGDALNVIVLDFAHTRRYYEDEFDEDEVKPPTCSAVNLTGKDMVPFETVPEKQSDACNTCWANQYGSSERRARAKACKSGRRLILIAAGEDYHEDDDPDLVRLRLPVMTMKAWDEYVGKLKATTGKPCFGVVTELSFDRSVDYPKLKFKAIEEVEPSYGKVILAARERARQMLLAVPDFSQSAEEEGEAPAPRGKKKKTKAAKVSKKKGGKKKSSKKSSGKRAAKKKSARSKFS